MSHASPEKSTGYHVLYSTLLPVNECPIPYIILSTISLPFTRQRWRGNFFFKGSFSYFSSLWHVRSKIIANEKLLFNWMYFTCTQRPSEIHLLKAYVRGVSRHTQISLVFCILFFVFVFSSRVNFKINWTLLSAYVLVSVVRLVNRHEWIFSFLKNGRIKLLECTLLIKCSARAYANKCALQSLAGTASHIFNRPTHAVFIFFIAQWRDYLSIVLSVPEFQWHTECLLAVKQSENLTQ